jgi:hypothetical protein
MTTMHLPTPPLHAEPLLGREIDDLLLQLRGLVLVRDLLAERGASMREIDAHAREADRVSTRLARLIRGYDGDVGGLDTDAAA